MPKRLTPIAKRFHTLWEHRQGRTILMMKRDEWDEWEVLDEGTMVLLDTGALSQSPLAPLACNPSFILGIATRTPEVVEIAIYRSDPKDPVPYNVDRYTVHEYLPSDMNIDEMIQTASTGVNLNFEQYLKDHVFIMKESPGSDHWLKKLPTEVRALMKKVSPSRSGSPGS